MLGLQPRLAPQRVSLYIIPMPRTSFKKLLHMSVGGGPKDNFWESLPSTMGERH